MPATGGAVIGKNCKLYIVADGDISGTPTWVEAGKVQGVNSNSSYNLAEIEERGEDDVLVLPGHRTREVTFQLTHRPGNAQYDAIQEAYEDAKIIGVAVMSGEISDAGQRGYQAEMYVTQFDHDQSNTNAAVAVTLRPAADYTTAPAFVEIAA